MMHILFAITEITVAVLLTVCMVQISAMAVIKLYREFREFLKGE